VTRVEDAAQRIVIRPDGALVHRTGTEERVLLGSGELEDVALIPDGAVVGGVRLPAGSGEWVLLRGRERSIALSVPGWTPGQPAFPTDPLTLSGIRALLNALGHADPGAIELDQPDAEVLLNTPGPLVLDPRARPSRRPPDLSLQAVRVIGVLLLVLFVGEAVVSRIVVGDEASNYPPTALALVAVLLALPLLSVLVGPHLPRRRPARRPGQTTVSPGLWAAAGGRPQVTVIDEGAALLVVDPDGTATAVPGPILGGAVKVFVLAADGARPTSTALLTANSEVLMSLPATWWPTDDDAVHVQKLLRDAGLQTSKQRVPRAAVQPPEPRRLPSPATDEVAWVTFSFAALLCFASVLSEATIGSVVAGSTVALASAVLLRERRRLR